MKIIITGSFGNRDIGDDAMLTMHLENLKKQGFEKKDIVLLGIDPVYMSWYWNHPIENCHSGFKHLNIKDYDCALITGGGTINTRTNSSSIDRMHYLVKELSVLPVFMSGQTIGPLGINNHHDVKAKEIIELVDILTVRDKKYSKTFIKQIGAKPKKLYETNDDATHLDIGTKPKVRNIIAVNITEYTSDTPEKINIITRICKELLKSHKVVLIPHHPVDYKKLVIIKSLINHKNCSLLDISNMRGRDVKKVISNCKAAIGGRYHFIVFCLSAGIPCVGMAGNWYSDIKQNGFAEQIGWEKYITKDCNYDNVMKLFNEVKDKKVSKCKKTKSFEIFNKWLTRL